MLGLPEAGDADRNEFILKGGLIFPPASRVGLETASVRVGTRIETLSLYLVLS